MEIPIKYRRNLLAIYLVALTLGLLNVYNFDYNITSGITIRIIFIIVNTVLLIQVFRGKVL